MAGRRCCRRRLAIYCCVGGQGSRYTLLPAVIDATCDQRQEDL